MKKIKKYLAFSGLLMALFTVTVVASSQSFYSRPVPSFQNYNYIESNTKDTAGDYNGINLTRMTADSVTFSATAVDSSGKDVGWTGYTTVYYIDNLYKIVLGVNYNSGQKMRARFRNSNWTPYEREITGIYYYY